VVVALTIRGVEVVHVCIAKGATGDRVTADTNTAQSQIQAEKKQKGPHLATGPIMLKISKSMASVTVGSSSPT
jgi:hypothetical protein